MAVILLVSGFIVAADWVCFIGVHAKIPVSWHESTGVSGNREQSRKACEALWLR